MNECLTIGIVMPPVSHSWKPSVPISSVRTWPVMNTVGVESSIASAIAVTRLVAPGPEVAKATPTRPEALAYPSAAWPPPCSWRTWTWRNSASTRASQVGRLAPPGIPKTSLTPSALRLSINVSAARIELAMVAAALRLACRRFRRIPAGLRLDRRLDHAAFVALDRVDDRLDQLLAQQRRLEAEVEELRVDRVVVVLFLLDPGVLDVVDRNPVAEVLAGLLDQLRQPEDRELLGELVEDAHLAALGWVVDRQLDAVESVADVEEAAGLAAGAVDGERVADHRLHAEAVEDGAEELVVVETGREALVACGLLGLDAVDDALVEGGRAGGPGAAGEVDVGRVVDLRAVVERARQLREGQRVLAALVLDLDVALLDVDAGLAVLAHRPELDQVRVGDVVAHREEQVEVADHVGVLGFDRTLAREHRERRRGLLAVVDDRLGRRLGDDLVEEVAVLDGADVAADLLAGDLVPGGDPLVEAPDRGQRVGAVFGVPAAAGEVVDDGDFMAAGREAERRRPAEVAVAPEDEDSHEAGTLIGWSAACPC